MKLNQVLKGVIFLFLAIALNNMSALATTDDGEVLGATKIIDNGPAGERFDLVLIAEGYQEAEQDKFAADVQNFIDFFFSTPPFSTSCSAFNVWRIDVASTDSGADDPVECGGSGEEVDTYFDASFCISGNRRGLEGNAITVIDVLSANVPDWDKALIIVNSVVSGGTGGEFAWTSVDPGWTYTAVHEIGHTAFNLADEYTYWKGCGIDEDRDYHPAAEPLKPNVTIETNRDLIKWGDLILETTPVPTTQNADCTQCDPQGDPYPGETVVGIYEGGNNYHCDVFRPAFNCMMRNYYPFCPVCTRAILQVLELYEPPDPSCEGRLIVTKAGSGLGTVTSNPAGIDCGHGGSDCTEAYRIGTIVTLTADPVTGHYFNGWEGCDSTTGFACTVAVSAKKEVTAAFTPFFIGTIDTSGRVSDATSIAVDSSYNVHISYHYEFELDGHLMYTNYNNFWTPEFVDPSDYFDEGFRNSIALDSLDNIHISYFSYNEFLDYFALKYATNASGSWVTEEVGGAGEIGTTSIATDSSDNVHISYTDLLMQELYYVTNESGFWMPETVESNVDVGYGASIAIDSQDKVHISYCDVTNNVLRYATNASGSWVKETVDSAGWGVSFTSIATDSSDNVHISYNDLWLSELKYATNASGSWVKETVDSAGWVGWYNSIAIDSQDKVHISHRESMVRDNLKYATNKSGSWVNWTIDVIGDVGTYTSIALDSGDNPHISYLDYGNGYLKYAMYLPIIDSLEVLKSGTGSGSVTSNPPGIDCGTDCEEGYDRGYFVTLTATPDADSTPECRFWLCRLERRSGLL